MKQLLIINVSTTLDDLCKTKIRHFLYYTYSAVESKSDIKVLALTIRDGVLLCNLIHFLDPSIGFVEFNKRPGDIQVEIYYRIGT